MKILPKVSIIIPVFNGSNYLRQAIDSALSQTYPNFEVMVINDGSTDRGKTELTAKSFGRKIRYFHKKNGGVASALNYGIKKMKGEWFSWLSHDDIYFPDKLKNQISLVLKNPKAKFVYAKDIEIDSQGKTVKPICSSDWIPGPEPQIQQLLRANPISGCTTLIHKSVFGKAGLFNKNNLTAQDGEMWIMISAYFRLHRLGEIVLKRRKHKEMGSKIFAAQNKKDIIQTVRNIEDRLTVDKLFPDRQTDNKKTVLQCHLDWGNFLAQYWGLYDLARKHYQIACSRNSIKSLGIIYRQILFDRYLRVSYLSKNWFNNKLRIIQRDHPLVLKYVKRGLSIFR